MDWLADFISAILSPFTKVVPAVMGAITNGFTSLFLVVNDSGNVTGVSNFGYFVGLILGISLVLGLTKFVTSFARRKI